MGGQQAVSFEQFVVSRSGALQQFAYLLTGSAEDARDVVQDALAGLYPRWRRVIAAGDPEAYLRRSIVNANISRWRRTRHETPWDPGVFEVIADQASPDVLKSRLLVAGCAALPARQRAAVVLRYYEDLEYDETGRLCGCSAGAARVLVHRAVAALRAGLDEEDRHG
ncbi:MAG: SigE family RNA polymerase sigma factor [Propionicimonas sp.]